MVPMALVAHQEMEAGCVWPCCSAVVELPLLPLFLGSDPTL